MLKCNKCGHDQFVCVTNPGDGPVSFVFEVRNYPSVTAMYEARIKGLLLDLKLLQGEYHTVVCRNHVLLQELAAARDKKVRNR